jgi:hypothetical protein
MTQPKVVSLSVDLILLHGSSEATWSLALAVLMLLVIPGIFTLRTFAELKLIFCRKVELGDH